MHPGHSAHRCVQYCWAEGRAALCNFERERLQWEACADLYRFCAALLASCWAKVRFFQRFTLSLVRLKKPCDPLLGPADPSAPKIVAFSAKSEHVQLA